MKTIKFIVLILCLIGMAYYLQPDDKELFMGVNAGTATVRPNVVILMDSSGSMNTIIFYPKKGLDNIENTADDGYNPSIVYSGTIEGFDTGNGYQSMSSTEWQARWLTSGSARQYTTSQLSNINGKNYWTGCYATDGSGVNFQVGTNQEYFYVGDRILFRDGSSPIYSAVATLKRKYSSGGATWFELSDVVGGPITPNSDTSKAHFQKCPDGYTRVPVIAKMYGTSDHSQPVRWPENYLKWLFIYATDAQRASVSHFCTYGTFNTGTVPATALSECATPGNDSLSGPNPRIKQVFTRIQTAREVICKVAKDSNKIVKLGLFKFAYEEGAELVEHLNDMSDESSDLVSYKNNVYDIYGGTWTPLAEALADIWYYYKPGPSTKTYWPVDYEIQYNLVNHNPDNPSTVMDYWCQNNYVIIMTDGESTKDGFNTKYSNSVFKKKPVKRVEPWTSWNNGWGDMDTNDASSGIPTNYKVTNTYCPNYTCWLPDSGGTDYLDDVAYLIRHQDMLPDSFFGDDKSTGWPGDQNIYTYTIGFTADNNLLRETAVNGDGGYYTANNYEELVSAFQNVITNINLRNFAFSSITAPRKTVTATNDELTLSYVGFFMPSASAAIWEGHLLAYKLLDSWGFDSDESGEVNSEEFVYKTKVECLNASEGKECVRQLTLDLSQEWDAADLMSADRNLYTNDSDYDLISFNLANQATLTSLFGGTVTDSEADTIINKVRMPFLADIFHSDVGFIGPPVSSKRYIKNLDSKNSEDEKFADFYEANKDRKRVLYVGTNDGIFHMFNADGVDAGKEVWGLIPDEVLTSYPNMILNSQHTYTVDGRLTANDIYFPKTTGEKNTWSTIMTFGLRSGGKAYYAMDVTTVGTEPKLLWKFKDTQYSGESWGKPIIGKILIQNPDNAAELIDKWVVFLTGGFAFNSENSNDKSGKAIFMLDAATGEPLWILAYHSTDGAGVADAEVTEIPVTNDSTVYHLTKSKFFNFPIASALNAVDVDNDGYIDTLYFGNLGGHLFKSDIHSTSLDNWKTYLMYKTLITTAATATINSKSGSDLTMSTNKDFVVGYSIMGQTSKAVGYITAINNKVFTVTTNFGTFQAGETVNVRTYDPIYLSPQAAFDTSYQLWVTFGSGDRDRPRTDPLVGKFVAIKDNGQLANSVSTLTPIYWNATATELTQTETVIDRGFYFSFRDPGEKLFDPEPVILPDDKNVPHIYFNTYLPVVISKGSDLNPCDVPREGIMTVYDISIAINGLNDVISGSRNVGRIAGGGTYQGKEYVMYKSSSSGVATVPDDKTYTESINFTNIGGLVYWMEKKR